MIIPSASHAGLKETFSIQLWANALQCQRTGTYKCFNALTDQKPQTITFQFEKYGKWFFPDRFKQKIEIGSTPFEYDVIASKCPDRNSSSGHVYKFDLSFKNLLTHEVSRTSVITESQNVLNEVELRAPSLENADSTLDPFLKIAGPSHQFNEPEQD